MSPVNSIQPSPSMGSVNLANAQPVAQPAGEGPPGAPVKTEYGSARDSVGIASDTHSAKAAGNGASRAPLFPHQQTFNPVWRLIIRRLVNIPWAYLRNKAQAEAADIKLSDAIKQERFDSLVSGIDKLFGTEAKDRAVAITRINKNVPLTTRTIKATHKVAKAHQLREEARDYANHAQLEVWTRQGKTRLGHVGLSVSHAMQQDGTMSTNKTWESSDDRTYMSWFPSGKKTVPQLLQNPGAIAAQKVTEIAKKAMSMETPIVVPFTSESYVADMIYEMSDRTREKLSAGVKPRPNQALVGVRGDDGEVTKTWGTHADSRLAVPLMGDNYSRKTGQNQFAYFGLNERDLREGWNVLTEPQNRDNLVFDTVSTGENCAGRAAQMLEKAGAEAFLPLPKATFLQDPNAMDKYGRELMNIVSELNAKASVVDEAFRPPPAVVDKTSLPTPSWEPKVLELERNLPFPRPTGAGTPAPEFMPGETQPYSEDYVVPPTTANITSENRKRHGTTLALGLARQIEMLGETHTLFAHLTPLRDALKIVGASDAEDFKTLTNQCKVLVNALHAYAIQPIDVQAMPFLVAAHASLATLQAACNGVCRMDKVPIVGSVAEAPEAEEAPVVAAIDVPPPNKRARARLAREAVQAAQAREAAHASLANQSA